MRLPSLAEAAGGFTWQLISSQQSGAMAYPGYVQPAPFTPCDSGGFYFAYLCLTVPSQTGKLRYVTFKRKDMIAVMKTGGKQYLVKAGDEVKVEKLLCKEGEVVVIDEVLMVSDPEGKDVKTGQPYVVGAKVECLALKQDRHPKVTTVKYKSKVRYRRQKGHRQAYTQLKVNKITL